MSSALKTDRYELTMLDAAIQAGVGSKQVVFEVFSRNLPAGRRFGVFAGTGRLIPEIQNFKFEQKELAFLEDQQIVSKQTLDWLANFSFGGEIVGFSEGEIYFGNSPVLTVSGTFAECVVLETLILSVLNYDSAVASAAARMRVAAGDRKLVEMGSRRANEDAAVAAARASFIAGFDATSNLLAHQQYQIPSTGTSGHAFTLLFESEQEAFQAQHDAMGDQTTFLLDTFDVEKAVETAVRTTDGRLGNVRIDSGDLSESAHRVRNQLDSLGATKTQITVTNDLDEDAIAGLSAAPVDGFGVGTSLVTGSGHPTASFVYKLVSKFENGEWLDVSKKSMGKQNLPGKKSAYRIIDKGVAQRDELSTSELQDSNARPLQIQYFGQSSDWKPDLQSARKRFQSSLNELPASARRLSDGDPALEVGFTS